MVFTSRWFDYWVMAASSVNASEPGSSCAKAMSDDDLIAQVDVILTIKPCLSEFKLSDYERSVAEALISGLLNPDTPDLEKNYPRSYEAYRLLTGKSATSSSPNTTNFLNRPSKRTNPNNSTNGQESNKKPNLSNKARRLSAKKKPNMAAGITVNNPPVITTTNRFSVLRESLINDSNIPSPRY